MFRKIFVVATVLCVMSVLSYAGAGTSGAQFLKIVSAPRPAALGGTYGAVSGDVNCIAMNPAGLSYLDKKQVVLSQNSWIQDISNQYLAFGMPMGSVGIFGFGLDMVSAGNMTKTDNAGNELGSFGSNDMAVTLAYARTFGEKIGAGINLKYIGQRIDDVNATGFAVDLGGMMKVSSKIDVGLAVQNLGGQIKFISEGDPLPMNVKIGSKMQISEPFMAALDVNLPNDRGAYVGFGIEYYLGLGKSGLPLRLGYHTGETAGGLSGLGVGVGFDWKNKLGLDIGWVPFGDLGDTFKVGINFNF